MTLTPLTRGGGQVGKGRLAWLPMVLLTACGSEGELDDYIARIRASTTGPIEPLPLIAPFSPMGYRQDLQPSPFIAPQPAIPDADPDGRGKPDCFQPAADRKKERLERYALASLSMRGTMGKAGGWWALILSPDGQFRPVGLNQYMGLDQGRVIRITDSGMDLMETVADGKGCWVTRATRLAMAKPGATP